MFKLFSPQLTAKRGRTLLIRSWKRCEPSLIKLGLGRANLAQSPILSSLDAYCMLQDLRPPDQAGSE